MSDRVELILLVVSSVFALALFCIAGVAAQDAVSRQADGSVFAAVMCFGYGIFFTALAVVNIKR